MLSEEFPLTLQWARAYLSLGWSVIPLRPGDKKPSIKWEKYQTERPTDDDLVRWFGDGKKNIAIVTGTISKLAVVDIDTSAGWKALEPVLKEHTKTPIVTTPRGGRHLYYLLPNGKTYGNNVKRVDGADFRCEGGYVAAPPSVGANGTPYGWKVGLEMPLLALPLQYICTVLSIDKALECSEGKTVYIDCSDSSKVVTSRHVTFTDGRRDEDLFTTAYSLVLGGMQPSSIEQVLYFLTKSWNEPEDEAKVRQWVKDKIKSAEKRAKSRQAVKAEPAQTLADEVREWVKSSKGVFKSSEVVTELGKSSRVVTDLPKSVSKILSRLVDEGMLVRDGKRYGMFRRVEEVASVVDWQGAAIESTWDLTYPFGIHDLYNTLPKNIIVLDGTTDSGKTAFLLNIAYLNSLKYPGRIHYFTSEMGAMELRSRLERFENPGRFNDVLFYERCENFADVVRPDDINIIDFLELSDEFYKVGGLIRDIHDRLGKGVCFIARQKTKGATSGRGGDFGKEKARLVLLMDPGTLKIDKCKNWKDPTKNPNGTEWGFKLIGGCRFVDKASNILCEGEF